MRVMMAFSMSTCFAATAPQAWHKPEVSGEVVAKIFYQPISHASLAAIPINDSKEAFVDLLEVNNPRLIPLSSVCPEFTNTYQGFSRVRLSVYQRLLKMLDVLPKDIGIVYFEGFRSLAKQKEYFDNKFSEILAVIPDKELAYQETTKHVSPFIDNIPTHTTGAAIDMALFQVTAHKKSLLDMGKFDVIFGPNPQQETFSENTTMQQRQNRLLLLETAINAGFANYGFEWWHFSYGDKMYAKVYGKPNAIYGLASDEDDSILSITKDDYFGSRQ